MSRRTLFRCLAGLIPILAATLTAADGENPGEAFYAALRANDLPRLDAMLKQGAKVNIVGDSTGATPLMYAASVGSADAMKILLDHGADVDLKSNADATALMW